MQPFSHQINYAAFVSQCVESHELRVMELQPQWCERTAKERRREAIRRAQDLLQKYNQQKETNERTSFRSQ